MSRHFVPCFFAFLVAAAASCSLVPLPSPDTSSGGGGEGGAGGGASSSSSSSSSGEGGAAGAGGAPAGPGAAVFAEHQIAAFDIHLSLSDVDSLNENPKKYVKADVDVTIGGETRTIPDVGVHLKGNAGSLRDLSQKAAFLLKFNEFEKGQLLDGLEKLALNNMVQDSSTIHEQLGYALMHAVGVPAPRAGYATVRVNGEPYGLYATIEPTDNSEFLKAHFGSDKGNLYEGAYGSDFQMGSLHTFDQDNGTYTDMADLKALVTALDEMQNPDTLVEDLSAVIDLDEYLHFAATEIFLGHWDGYAWTKNNFFVYRRPSDNRWVFIPWGIDQTFAQYLNPFGGDGRIQQMCLGSAPCRAKLALAFKDVLAALGPLELTQKAGVLKNELWPAIQDDPRKEMSEQQCESAIDATIEYLNNRPQDVEQALLCADPNTLVDLDQDGSPGCGTDCNDKDPNVYPGAPEACNFIDDDCNGVLDDLPNCSTCKTVPNPAGGSFLFCTDYFDWYSAESDCVSRGGHLASIHDYPTQKALYQEAFQLVNADWWIGANDDQQEGSFAWTDGTPLDYTAWHSGEPNDSGGENCASLAVWANGNWNDATCWNGMPYVCQIP